MAPMGFYRPINFSGSGRGTSSDSAFAGHKVMENILTVNNLIEAPACGKEAAKLFADSVGGIGSAASQALPKLELAGREAAKSLASTSIMDKTLSTSGTDLGSQLTSGTENILHGLIDAAAKMASPMGFMHAIFEFLKSLFSMDALSNIGNFLQNQQLLQVNMYYDAADAAQNALDMKKLALSF
jgi:hypothetical protein